MSQIFVYSEALILDLVFGTNEHPRRDTDVILRQSKAPIVILNSRSVLCSNLCSKYSFRTSQWFAYDWLHKSTSVVNMFFYLGMIQGPSRHRTSISFRSKTICCITYVRLTFFFRISCFLSPVSVVSRGKCGGLPPLLSALASLPMPIVLLPRITCHCVRFVKLALDGLKIQPRPSRWNSLRKEMALHIGPYKL